MIVSVSRRTDIPAFYSDWFFRRLEEGYALVKNPVSPHQVSKVGLTAGEVDCFVFWTKNPAPMLGRLERLCGYMYYFQYTLTPYGNDIEKNIPTAGEAVKTFKRLSEMIGNNRLIWRYDPILINKKYTAEYHLESFARMAASLEGYTKRCVISFLDIYRKIKKNMEKAGAEDILPAQMYYLAKELHSIAKNHGMKIFTCSENIDLSAYGVEHGSCIDPDLISELLGCRVTACRDKNQRPSCGCVQSVDIGAYNTCPGGCIYCYANSGVISRYIPGSPMLCGETEPGDIIKVRKMETALDRQLTLF